MTRLDSVRGLLTGITAVATFMGVLFVPAGLLHAQASPLFISEYVEGSGSNQAIEIYNPGDMAVNLSASGYSMLFLFDGSTSNMSFVALSGTVPAGGTWVVANAAASAALLARANQTAATTWFDGNDAVALIQGGTAVDVIGQIGFDPGTAWGSGDVTTRDHTLRRKASVTQGDSNGFDAFDPATEWNAYASDTFDGLGWYGTAPNAAVSITCPADVTTTQGLAATAALSATDPDGTVTSLAVTSVTPADPGTITITGVTTASTAGGTATGSLSVSPSTPVGSFSVTVEAANDDATAQTAACDIGVTVSPATVDSLRALLRAMATAGDMPPAKTSLLLQRLDRVDAALAAGRTADATAQLRAFGNQVAGFSPRWLSADTAAALIRETALVASSL
jgi:predicted extracellular nuclease